MKTVFFRSHAPANRYNSLSPVGSDWWSSGIISKYKMVRNIPRDFFDPVEELDVTPLFQNGYFEWQEDATDVA